jgi:hypothetical protein
MAAHYAAHGLADPQTLAAIRKRTDYYTGLVPAMPTRFVRLQDGDVLRIGGATGAALRATAMRRNTSACTARPTRCSSR